jgi:phosphatidylserine/phosphatidylglycerophosphate/cardiolipin synthase-like enzyme
MICTCKKTLDVVIFSLTIDSIAEAIIEAYQCGVKVRMIADDECAKNKGSNVIARVGISTKTDNAIYHMHHKFAIMDGSFVIMGSFNWTGQEAKYNQENIFFYEDRNITGQYAQEFERLWNSFDTVIDQKQAQIDVENDPKKKKKRKKKKNRLKLLRNKMLKKIRKKVVILKELEMLNKIW